MYCVLVIIFTIFSIFSQEPSSEILFKNRIAAFAQKAGSNWGSSLSQVNSTQQALLIPYYFFQQNNEEKILHHARNCHGFVKQLYKEKNGEKIANVHKIYSDYGIYWCLKKIGKQAQWKEAGLLSAKMYASVFCMLDPQDKNYKDHLDLLDSFFKHIPKERDAELEQLLSCMCDRAAWYMFSQEKKYGDALAYLDRATHFCQTPEILRSRAYIFMQSESKKKEGLSLLENFIGQHPDKALLKDYYNVGFEFSPLNNQCIQVDAQKSYKFFKYLVSDELIGKNKKNKNIEKLQANAFFQLSLLGMNYGKDISVSPKEIFDYCQKAADRGRCDAFCYAGIYEFTKKNIESARIYFQRAIDAIPATKGNSDNVHLISAKAVCHWYLGYCDMTEKDIPLDDIIVHWRKAIELYPEIPFIASELNNKDVIEKIKTKANLIKRCTEFTEGIPFIYLVGKLLEGLQDKDGANYLESALHSCIEAQYNAWSQSLQENEKIVYFLKLIDNRSDDSVAKEIKEKIEKTIHANAQKQKNIYSLLELILYYYKKNDLTQGLLWIEQNIKRLKCSQSQNILKLLKITSPQDWSFCYTQIKEQAQKGNKGAMLLYGFLLCEYHADEKEPDSITTDNLLVGIMNIEKFIDNNKDKKLLFCNYLSTKYMQLGSAFEQVDKFEGAKLAYEKGAEYGSTIAKILLLGLQLKSSKKNEVAVALDEVKKIADGQNISELDRATAFCKLGRYYGDKDLELAKMYYEKAKPVFGAELDKELNKLKEKQQNRRQLQDQKNNPIQIAIGEANTHFSVMEGLMNQKRFDMAIHAALKGLGVVQERIFIDHKIFLCYINHIRPKLTKLFNNVLFSKEEKIRELIDKLLIQAKFLGISVQMKVN